MPKFTEIVNRNSRLRTNRKRKKERRNDTEMASETTRKENRNRSSVVKYSGTTWKVVPGAKYSRRADSAIIRIPIAKPVELQTDSDKGKDKGKGKKK